MKGWKLFSHSVGLLVRNWQVAVRVSLVPFALIMAITYLTGSIVLMDEAKVQAMIREGSFPLGMFALLLVASAIPSAWMAVAWHRYVLLNETAGWIPTFHISRTASYIGVGLLLAIITSIGGAVIVGIPGGIVLGILGAIAGILHLPAMLIIGIFTILGLVLGGLFIGFMCRFLVIMPGVALGSEQDLFAGWKATKGAFLDISIAGTLAYGLAGIVNPAIQFLFRNNPELGVWLIFLMSWPLGLLGISLLTTLYGHYVEGRELP